MKVEVEEPILRLSQTTDEFSHVLDCQKHIHEQYLLKYTLLQKKRAENKEMPELEEEVRKREELYQTTTNNIVAEYGIYTANKSNELMAAMTSLANINLRFTQHASEQLGTLADTIDRILIESLPTIPRETPIFQPSAPPISLQTPPYPIAATEAISYDPTVRTIHGQPVGRVVSGRYVDLTSSTSAELLKDHNEHPNEEIIIGV